MKSPRAIGATIMGRYERWLTRKERVNKLAECYGFDPIYRDLDAYPDAEE